MSMTVADIRLAAQQRADMVNSRFLSDAEWLTLIDFSYKELYDILVSRFEDYYSTSTTFTISGGGSTYALPADFYKMRGLDRQLSGSDYYTLHPFTFEDRNRRQRTVLYRGLYPQIRYRILGSNIVFSPDDNADGNYRLWYVPRAVTLAADGDTVDGVNGWEDYIIVDAAIKALNKEESDVSVLMAQKEGLKKRIESMAQNRDAGECERVTDVTRTGGMQADIFFRGGW